MKQSDIYTEALTCLRSILLADHPEFLSSIALSLHNPRTLPVKMSDSHLQLYLQIPGHHPLSVYQKIAAASSFSASLYICLPQCS